MRLAVIAEGDGDKPAVRVILGRLPGLYEDMAQVQVGDVHNAHGRHNLTKTGGIEKFCGYAARDHDAVLVLLDADRDCPLALAAALAARMAACALGVPAAVVCANQAFETWFLADIESVRGRSVKGRILVDSAADIQESPERIVNPKARLRDLLMAREYYKESRDQPALAGLIDLGRVEARCRSFRRLISALRELQEAVAAGANTVTPAITA
jgi:hypothetical protein